MNTANAHFRYPFPWVTGLQVLADALLLRCRSFQADASRCVQPIASHLEITQVDHLPRNGPYLLVTNHYSRPGFGAWWIALGISAAVPLEIHWMMTNAWTHAGIFEPLTRWLFPRLARVYGFIPSPPMPPTPQEIAARVQAARRLLAVARSPGAVIALAPEGRDHPGGILGTPPRGAGRFIYQLSKYCQPIIPVGVYEDADHLHIRFGPPSRLEVPPALTAAQRDQHVSQEVMDWIARQLPPCLRGEYAQH